MRRLYLDWSGDAGFKFGRGSSRYLAFACIDTEMAFAAALGEFRARYSLAQTFYFRFTNASEFIKPLFFSAVGMMDLHGVVLRVDKTRLPSVSRRGRGDELLCLFAAETIARIPATAGEDRQLIFDGLRTEHALLRSMRIAISAKLRETEAPSIGRVVARRARNEDGLQIADMLAGAAASEHLAENALLGKLEGKVILIDYRQEK